MKITRFLKSFDQPLECFLSASYIDEIRLLMD